MVEEVASVTATAAVASATAMEEATAIAMAGESAARPRHRVTIAVSLKGSELGLLWSVWIIVWLFRLKFVLLKQRLLFEQLALPVYDEWVHKLCLQWRGERVLPLAVFAFIFPSPSSRPQMAGPPAAAAGRGRATGFAGAAATTASAGGTGATAAMRPNLPRAREGPRLPWVPGLPAVAVHLAAEPVRMIIYTESSKMTLLYSKCSFLTYNLSIIPLFDSSGDWPCPSCGNNCFGWRDKCNRCGASKAGGGGEPPRGVAAAPQGPPGLFTADDWACSACGNVNWARRAQCNQCNAPKPGTMDLRREGAAGGFRELDPAEAEEARRRRREREANEEYDEFGRRRRGGGSGRDQGGYEGRSGRDQGGYEGRSGRDQGGYEPRSGRDYGHHHSRRERSRSPRRQERY